MKAKRDSFTSSISDNSYINTMTTGKTAIISFINNI